MFSLFSIFITLTSLEGSGGKNLECLILIWDEFLHMHKKYSMYNILDNLVGTKLAPPS